MMSGYLRRFPLFEPLSDDDIALLERLFVVSDFPAGHAFVREGDSARATTAGTWLILDGRVHVSARAPAEEVARREGARGSFGVERDLGPGQFVGLLALLADLPRTATCTATSPVRAARLDRLTLQELLRHDAGVYARFQLVIARHLAADLRDLGTRLASSFRDGDAAAVRERFGA